MRKGDKNMGMYIFFSIFFLLGIAVISLGLWFSVREYGCKAAEVKVMAGMGFVFLCSMIAGFLSI